MSLLTTPPLTISPKSLSAMHRAVSGPSSLSTQTSAPASTPSTSAKRRRRDTDADIDSSSPSPGTGPIRNTRRDKDAHVPKKKKAARACFHCQKAHLTCDDCTYILPLAFDLSSPPINHMIRQLVLVNAVRDVAWQTRASRVTGNAPNTC
jgi:hypothetical protein